MLATLSSNGIGEYLLFGAFAFIVFLLILLFRNPRLLGKWALSGGIGCFALWGVNALSTFMGIGVGINLWTTGIAVILGFPGVAGLLILRVCLHL